MAEKALVNVAMVDRIRRRTRPNRASVSWNAQRGDTHKADTHSCAKRSQTLQWLKGAFTMTLRPEFRKRISFVALALAMLTLTISGASPARADRCDDLAAQLASQIDGLKVGITAAKVIYLSHPQTREMSLGCTSRKFSNELYAKSTSRKPKPEFIDLAAGAAAIIFTLPKDEMVKGVSRCLSRMGIFRGDDVSIRYRRLDMNCQRTKTDASIAISRSPDQ
jgi:hypothetical protein